MMSCDFQTTACGKWILAGEHAVLRGHPALVFPLPAKTLSLTWHRTEAPLTLETHGAQADILREAALAVLEVLRAEGVLNEAAGTLCLEGNLPVGVGLGASAAISVVFARWLAHLGVVSTSAIPAFAKRLEDHFHGKSSGLDIAGVAAPGGRWFCAGESHALSETWSPAWYLSSCGEQGATAACIETVRQLWQRAPDVAQVIDARMHESVTLAADALADSGPEALPRLVKAIEQAAGCFSDWGLVTDALKTHMELLRAQGALAVKPTGSGKGGYVLSLWGCAPPADLALMAAF
ncbi:mevalonate kinase family protein [Legionella geestiana]|nr:hypothetical protein [Legionella geestiana]